jgi:thioredoxin-dependent peroxiredoxin
MPMLEEGARAPDFSATDHNGETVKLSDYAGKYLLLWFYPAADTPG